MKLAALQQSLIKQVTQNHLSLGFLAELKPMANLPQKKQVTIYQHNATSALIEALRQIYPVCRTILGEAYFDQTAELYIWSHPSHGHDLHSYGETFAGFLAERTGQCTELGEYRYLGDLARLEWLYHRVTYAQETTKFDFQTFSKLSQAAYATVRFHLAATCFVVASSFPVATIWQLHQNDQQKPDRVATRAEKYCVYCRAKQPYVELLDSHLYNLLQRIAGGATLPQLADSGLHDYLPALIMKGWVGSFSLAGDARA